MSKTTLWAFFWLYSLVEKGIIRTAESTILVKLKENVLIGCVISTFFSKGFLVQN